MQPTVVRLPFGGRASTNRAQVRSVALGRFLLIVAGLVIGLILLFR